MNQRGSKNCIIDLKSMSFKYKHRMCLSDALSNKLSNESEKPKMLTKRYNELNWTKRNIFHISNSKISIFK